MTTSLTQPPTAASTRLLRAVATTAAASAREPRQGMWQIVIAAFTALGVIALFVLFLMGQTASRGTSDQLGQVTTLLGNSLANESALSAQIRSLGQIPVVAPPATVPGATGATGAQGTQGAQGVPGAAGPTGAPGPQGIAGVPGAAGTAGATGPAGPAGKDGTDGKDGATGATGATGPAGTPGTPGAPPAQITQHYADGTSSVCTRDTANPGPDSMPNYSCSPPTA